MKRERFNSFPSFGKINQVLSLSASCEKTAYCQHHGYAVHCCNSLGIVPVFYRVEETRLSAVMTSRASPERSSQNARGFNIVMAVVTVSIRELMAELYS